MKQSVASRLSDAALLSHLSELVVRDRATTAEMLLAIAEVDARKLYLPAAYPSMHAYCVGELRLSEEAAFKRIHAARAARRFPALFTAVEDGRLHLCAVVMLAPHLTSKNADAMIESATHKTRPELERLLAEHAATQAPRFALAGAPSTPTMATDSPVEHATWRVETPAVAFVAAATTTHAAPRYDLRASIDQETQDLLTDARAFLGHEIPSGDVPEVLKRVLKDFVHRARRRKFGATSRPRISMQAATNSRTIPAHVRRAVSQRDEGRCTFVSDAGRRCPARKCLEFDHVHEVARGGESTVDNVRLRCRAHNQYTAERTFGVGFMERKRDEARARAAGSAAEGARLAGPEAAVAEEAAKERDVVPYLRALGYRADEARRAAAMCDALPEASLEERVKRALTYFRLRGTCVRPSS